MSSLRKATLSSLQYSSTFATSPLINFPFPYLPYQPLPYPYMLSTYTLYPGASRLISLSSASFACNLGSPGATFSPRSGQETGFLLHSPRKSDAYFAGRTNRFAWTWSGHSPALGEVKVPERAARRTDKASVNEGVVAIGIIDIGMYKKVEAMGGILPSPHRAIGMPCLTLISLSKVR
jgi:hypothetical protein